jgi:hypothetical protein
MEKIILPKPHLSYSQMSMWLRNKDQYRERYYLNGPSFETRESIFGKTTAKMLEDGVKDKVLDRVPRYHFKEYRIEQEICGIPFLAVLDSFQKSTGSILEYKTSKNPWTPLMVQKHLQLDVYSLLVKLLHGYVDPWTKLVWIETEYTPELQQVGSRQLLGESNQLRFTGRIEIFKRRIPEWERQMMKQKIVRVAQEISEDYQLFLQSNGHRP